MPYLKEIGRQNMAVSRDLCLSARNQWLTIACHVNSQDLKDIIEWNAAHHIYFMRSLSFSSAASLLAHLTLFAFYSVIRDVPLCRSQGIRLLSRVR